MKSGSRNFLEPSGPLQACNGTALPLPLPLLAFICQFLDTIKCKTNPDLRNFKVWKIVSLNQGIAVVNKTVNICHLPSNVHFCMRALVIVL